MLKTLQNALKIKDIRSRLIFTVLMAIVVRFGSQLPVPGTNAEAIRSMISGNENLSLVDTFTGGSFENFSLMTLSITPYITSSIIMQLMTIAIPALEEMQKEGEDGRKKIAAITRYVTVALALIESTALTISFSNSGLLDVTDDKMKWVYIPIVVLALTAGSAFLMWIGEQITEKGIGNGISIVLLVNIISRAPTDVQNLYEQFMKGKAPAFAILAALIMIAILTLVIVLTVILYAATRKIPVQYAKKIQGRRMVGGQSSFIPLKVNTGGVIPIIFASSILSIPMMIAQFIPNINADSIGGKLLNLTRSSMWFRIDSETWWYTAGYLLYAAMVLFFAYFYTSITFNPVEIAENLKKQGGFIPGIRPGRPTSDHLNHILNYIVFVGAVGLLIVASIPLVVQGVWNTPQLQCGGTSLIIVVGVILETIKQVESKMLVRNYQGFLNV